MKRIILYGGAFDPIHNGHIRIAEAASSFLKADVVFIPTKKPRWKEANATDEDRVNMLKIALEEAKNPAFSYSLCEMEREGETTYSCDTVAYFKEKYPDSTLFFLIGGDQVSRFDQWKNPDFIASNCQIYYVGREGYIDQKGNKERFHMSPLSFVKAGIVSSTGIRNLTYIDAPVRVLDYIQEHRLYYMKKLESYLSSRRLSHSLSVARLSYRIALENGLEEPGKAYVAGALHDIGKEYPKEKADIIMRENYPSYMDVPGFCVHQWVGAYLAEREFHIEDPVILDAIAYHCSGKADMSPFGKIVYAADKIDPSRGWPSEKYIRLCLKDYDKGFQTVLSANREFLTEKGKGDPESILLIKQCFDCYLGGK